MPMPSSTVLQTPLPCPDSCSKNLQGGQAGRHAANFSQTGRIPQSRFSQNCIEPAKKRREILKTFRKNGHIFSVLNFKKSVAVYNRFSKM
jgi:hypothetical protein